MFIAFSKATLVMAGEAQVWGVWGEGASTSLSAGPHYSIGRGERGKADRGGDVGKMGVAVRCGGRRARGGGGAGAGGLTFNRASSVMTGALGLPCLPGTCTGVTSCTATPLHRVYTFWLAEIAYLLPTESMPAFPQ